MTTAPQYDASRFRRNGRGKIYDSIVDTIGDTPLVRLPRLTAALKQYTGRAWKVTTDAAPGAPTMRERHLESKEVVRAEILSSPVVKAAFEAFPDAVLPEEELDRLIAAKRS